MHSYEHGLHTSMTNVGNDTQCTASCNAFDGSFNCFDACVWLCHQGFVSVGEVSKVEAHQLWLRAVQMILQADKMSTARASNLGLIHHFKVDLAASKGWQMKEIDKFHIFVKVL